LLGVGWLVGSLPERGAVAESTAGEVMESSVRRGPDRALRLPASHFGEGDGDTGQTDEEAPAREGDLLGAVSEEEPEEEGLALLRVQVFRGDGEVATPSYVEVLDCEVFERFYAGEGAWVVLARPGVCRVQGRAPDGLLFARSEWQEVELMAGDEVSLSLDLPEERTGGLGVAIIEHDLGIEVQRVLPGTPADRMGLVEGDVIIEVDGLPSSTLEIDEFIEVMTGPAGTEVEFVLELEVDTGFEQGVLVLERAVIERW
jgi:hypothetical protein